MKPKIMTLNLTLAEATVVHDALVYFIETEDYTDAESVIITELLDRLDQEKKNNAKSRKRRR